MTDADCLFCRIVAGEIPADKVAETEDFLAFRDIAPKAPTHVLVVPKRHFADAPALAAGEPRLVAELVALAQRIADDECGGQFQLTFNTGADAGQTVFHAHGHVLGGGKVNWDGE